VREAGGKGGVASFRLIFLKESKEKDILPSFTNDATGGYSTENSEEKGHGFILPDPEA